MSDVGHDDLASNLAKTLRLRNYITVENWVAGPAWSSGGRPDVLTVEKTYNRLCPITYEVKVSRSDFLSDVKSGKWMKYLEYSSGVYFAVPRGLIKKTELPDGVGLTVFNGENWRAVKKPTISPVEWDKDLFLSMIMHIEGKRRRFKPPRPAEFNRLARERHELGAEISGFLRDRGAARYQIESLEKQIELKRQRLADIQEKISKATDDAKPFCKQLMHEFRRHGVNIPYYETSPRELADQVCKQWGDRQIVTDVRRTLETAMKSLPETSQDTPA